MTILALPGAIQYDDADFKTVAPDFVNCTPAQGQSWFNGASMMCSNDPSNPLVNQVGGNLAILQRALYLLTAHIGWLNAPRDPNGNPTGQAAGAQVGPKTVGRISSGNQGSVSVSLDMGSTTPAASWYQQTPWGAEYWEMTKQVRTFSYFATPTRVPQPRGGGFGPFGGSLV